MNRRTAAGVATIVTALSGPALAHPGHGITDPATPLHQFEHLGLLASSPLIWLALALSGLLVYRLLSHRRHASRRRR
jgi:hypothetical protein